MLGLLLEPRCISALPGQNPLTFILSFLFRMQNTFFSPHDLRQKNPFLLLPRIVRVFRRARSIFPRHSLLPPFLFFVFVARCSCRHNVLFMPPPRVATTATRVPFIVATTRCHCHAIALVVPLSPPTRRSLSPLPLVAVVAQSRSQVRLYINENSYYINDNL